MIEPLKPPRRKNPVARTRQPTLPPAQRSRTSFGLTAAAAEGRFALQVCVECGTVQYPPRDACCNCLSEHLPWQDVSPWGELQAITTLHHSNDLYFRERLPWRVGLVRMEAGPVVVTHVHEACAEGERVRLSLRLDRAGQAVMVAMPGRETPHMMETPLMRELTCDPKFRRVLVTDAKSEVGQATVRALLAAEASLVFAGDPQAWRHNAGYEALLRDPRVQPVLLDVTDTDSVDRLAGQIGGKVDILINTADMQRDGGIMYQRDVNVAREIFDVNCFGLMRLAQAFGPAMCSRTADGVNNAAAWVNIMSIYARASLPPRGMWSAANAAALSVTQCLRAEMRPSGLRVVNVFVGPVDQEWEQRTPPPRVPPANVARAVVQALQQGTEDVYVGDVAAELRDRLADNPKAVEHELGRG